MNKLKLGIKVIDEIIGNGLELHEGCVFNAVYKYYKNGGDPFAFDHPATSPVPTVVTVNGEKMIGYDQPTMITSNTTFDECVYKRSSGLLPGLYYGMMGIKVGRYRFVRIPPEFMFKNVPFYDLKPNSILKVEIFLLKLRNE